MNRRILIIAAVTLVAAVSIGIFCYTRLEIVSDVRWKGPSREARSNSYLAMDRWLAAEGIPVRALSAGTLETITNAGERTIFIEESRFNWSSRKGTAEQDLVPWVRKGGRLIVSLDTSLDPSLETYMNALGIKAVNRYSSDDDETDEETVTDETKTEAVPEAAAETEKDSGTDGTSADTDDADIPGLDWQWNFKITEKKPFVDRILVIAKNDKDEAGKNKPLAGLVKLEMGEGWVVFTGEAYFLHNYYLKDGENAALAAELFLSGAGAESTAENSVLFIRGLSGDRRFFGSLAERGNPGPLLAGLGFLLLAGFWMVLPGFGRYRFAPERPGKALRERFLAEGRFLKKYRALEKYIEAYERELEQRRRAAVPFSVETAANAEPSAAAELSAGTKRAAETTEKRLPGGMYFHQFLKTQRALLDQLDTLDKAGRPEEQS